MMKLIATPKGKDILIGVLLLVLLAAIPQFGVNRYYLGQIVLFMIYAAVASHWNLIFGYTGVFSLAHLTMFGMGAYGMAMSNFYLGVPIWFAIPIGGLTALVTSLVLGLATLRLAGVYTALLTLAFAQVIYVLIVTDTECFMRTETSCRMFTGGAAGFYGFQDFGTREVYKGQWLMANYYIVLAAAMATMAATVVVAHSAFGIAMMALRDNPAYAQALGVNKLSVHLKVFIISAFLTGIMGAVYAGHIRTVSPSVMSLTQMLFIIAAVVLGGSGKTWGPVLGLAVLMTADELLRDYGNARQIGIGIILILSPIALKRGILGIKLPMAVSRTSNQTSQET